jgi:hypothetical protein
VPLSVFIILNTVIKFSKLQRFNNDMADVSAQFAYVSSDTTSFKHAT